MRRRLRESLSNPFVVIPFVALAVLAAFGVWWFGIRGVDDSAGAATPTRQVVTATSGPMNETVSAEGTVAAAQSDDLSFSSSGTVTAVNVKAGDTVTTGQVLATIDSAELQAAVTSAESKLADAQASLADDKGSGASAAQITADESSVTSANDALTNAQEGLAGAALVATFDGTVASVDLTVGEQLTSGGTGATGTTGSGSGSGRSSASIGATGTSPVGGNGSSTGSDSSSSTSAQIQVVSAGRFTVDLAVDSADIASIAVGQSAKVTLSTSSSAGRFGAGRFAGGFNGFNGFGGTGNGSGGATASGSNRSASGASTATTGASATGSVTAVGQVADASSGVATYPVTISFTSAGTDFYVGSTVTGAITTKERADVIQVPTFAVTTTGTTSTVLVATDGTATGATETRTVTTGLRADGMIEIADGLKAGDKIIVTIGGIRPGGAGGFSPPTGGFQTGQVPGGVG